jgi:hypothetical protein
MKMSKKKTNDLYFEILLILFFVILLFYRGNSIANCNNCIQGDFENCADIFITSCWRHVELGKNI